MGDDSLLYSRQPLPPHHNKALSSLKCQSWWVWETLTYHGCDQVPLLLEVQICSPSVFLTSSFSLPFSPGPPLCSPPLSSQVKYPCLFCLWSDSPSPASPLVVVTESSSTVMLNVFFPPVCIYPNFICFQQTDLCLFFCYFGPKFTLWTWHCCLVSLLMTFWGLVVDSQRLQHPPLCAPPTHHLWDNSLPWL